MSTYRWQRIVALVPLFAVLAAIIPLSSSPALANHTPMPTSVTIAGNFQEELGCPGDWQPQCAVTHLTNQGNGVWRGQFNVPAGDWQYKAALNNAWNESYAGNHQAGGNTTLTGATGGPVRFYYDHKTHAVLDSLMDKVAVVAGSFQSELGCPGDWQPTCLRTLMTDPDGDGKYTFSSTAIPVGSYAFKVVLNEDASYTQAYPASDFPFTVSTAGERVTINWNSSTNEVTFGDLVGNLALAKAHWVTRDTIALNVDASATVVKLHYDPDGGMTLDPTGVVGGEAITLTYDPTGLDAATRAKFPHLAGYRAFKLTGNALNRVRELLKGQVVVSAATSGGTIVEATAIQIPGVLDDLYTYTGNLGVTFQGQAPIIQVWAPTAKSVKLHLFNDSNAATTSTIYNMTGDPETGVWSISGQPSWNYKYYLFEVEVYVRATGKVENNIVTDPYSLNLSINSKRSQIVNLDAPELKPAGWNAQTKPELVAPEDIVLYELHIRDFSASDPTVPEVERGTFKAFTRTSSLGMTHLKELAGAGLTHLHLLPAFDCATINENKAEWQSPDPAVLSTYGPASDQQAEAVKATADQDGFNWCYDPLHFTAPEGSYATNPDGTARIIEFREMVQSLNQNGLRVVMDVVYNHTSASGQNEKSVLDKVVPGYYHRLDPNSGLVEKSTCCENTATEHNMMEKLMVDSLVTWAKDYKVDAFRFDLMGHHMKRNMLNVRNTLQSLTIAKDGVDGSKIYIYGEGWNFGEVANNARGVNATQLNMPGTGIGTFNDRLRDAVRGGGPFDDGQNLKRQGFATGLFFDPNDLIQGTAEEQKSRLLLNQDQTRVGLAGNLRDYVFVDRNGNTVTGRQVDYNGSPTGYAADPQETINYVEAHDNQTLWDAVQVKAPADATLAERVRMHNLATDVVGLGQGVPFFHAGQDMLRSKSGTRDSYNAGDWFNRLDFTYQSNNWGVGMAPDANADSKAVLEPLLSNPALKPGYNEIFGSVEHFREMLRIRKSSKLFRLETAAEINARVRFHNTGPDQVPGVVVMSISDKNGVDLDRTYERIVVVFNASDEEQTITEASLAGVTLRLHSVQQRSSDNTVRLSRFDSTSGALTVPAHTTAVFVDQERFLIYLPQISMP